MIGNCNFPSEISSISWDSIIYRRFESVRRLYIKWRLILTKNISDDYHTLQELYKHRNLLFVNLINVNHGISFKTKHYIDNNPVEEGWFIAYMNSVAGQISYHLPIDLWNLCRVDEVPFNPNFDGHTSENVLERLEGMAK